MTLFIGYFLTLVMGMTLGMLGAGGSIFSVPILVYFFHLPPLLATSYSLILVGTTALMGSIQYSLKKQVAYFTALSFAIPSFIGVYLSRRYLLPSLPDPLLSIGTSHLEKNTFIMLLFSLSMLLASYYMIKPTKVIQLSGSLPSKILLTTLEGFFIGGFTGIIGAGGGFLIVPALVLFTGLEMSQAVGSSLLIIAGKSWIGVLGDWQRGLKFDWQLISYFLIFAITGMALGVFFSKFFEKNKLKKAFGYYTLCCACIILLKESLA